MAQAATADTDGGLTPLPDPPEFPAGADPYPRWPWWFGAAGFAIGVGSGIVGALILLPAYAIVTQGFDVHSDDALPVLELAATFFQDLGWVIGAIALAATIRKPKAWFFGGRIGNHDAAGGLALFLCAPNHDAIVQGTKFHS
jgi:hypothetical protein